MNPATSQVQEDEIRERDRLIASGLDCHVNRGLNVGLSPIVTTTATGSASDPQPGSLGEVNKGSVSMPHGVGIIPTVPETAPDLSTPLAEVGGPWYTSRPVQAVAAAAAAFGGWKIFQSRKGSSNRRF